MNYLLVFLGGGLGSISRFGISRLFSSHSFGHFPMGTFLSNILACLIMGIVLISMKEKTGFTEWNLFLLTGFCGGFSTFSTFGLETVQLIQNQNYLWAGLNILISVISSIFIIYLLLKFKSS